MNIIELAKMIIQNAIGTAFAVLMLALLTQYVVIIFVAIAEKSLAFDKVMLIPFLMWIKLLQEGRFWKFTNRWTDENMTDFALQYSDLCDDERSDPTINTFVYDAFDNYKKYGELK
jgi:hypothetical protein